MTTTQDLVTLTTSNIQTLLDTEPQLYIKLNPSYGSLYYYPDSAPDQFRDSIVMISVEPIKPLLLDECLDPTDQGTSKNQATEPIRPIHLYFSRNLSSLKIDDSVKEILQTQPRDIRLCTSWSELPNFLADDVLSICVDAKEIQHSTIIEIINMIHTMFKLVGKVTVPIAIAIWANTPRSIIRDLQRAGIHGIIPVHCDFGMTEAVKGCHALWNGVPYWPRHIVDQLPCQNKPAKSVVSKITLTPRQQQIITIISERGASNKTIARMLGITESTVKLHMSGILKKYGVRNRTQLALFARDKAEA